ncbi:MAG: conjugal transfer protein TraG [Alkaliphilus sp.]|nr:type IV secretory system conjugative DNA transfer family protein [Alkaliphilus sp. AH-315-G20]MBN4074414.1 type IV secretory system conjugative DNA transfer family protein [bacterium AH-315-E09]PHS36602.1 MAG: conjugal transfer protein TraG [Alkaliphilus sp.]
MIIITRAKKIKLFVVFSIIITSAILLPWLIKFSYFIIRDFSTAPEMWFNFGIVESWKSLLVDVRFRNIFLVLQISITVLSLLLLWDTKGIKKKNKLMADIGSVDSVGAGQHGTSRWMSEKEKDKFSFVWKGGELTEDDSGLVLGMKKKRDQEKIWLGSGDTHSLIVGATRSGKSRRLILPTIYALASSEESMVIGDPKGELYISAKEYLRKEKYKVVSLNLREPAKGNQWNLLDLLYEYKVKGEKDKVIEMAWDIAHTIVNQTPSVSSEPIWKNGAESVIASLILLNVFDAKNKDEISMASVYKTLATLGQPLADETIPLLDYISLLSPDHPAKLAFAAAGIAPYKTRASFFTTVLTDLRIFSDSNIVNMTSNQDHNLKNIGIEKTAVFLIVPDEKSTRNVLATLYIDQLYQQLVELANTEGGRILKRVNFILDEFGNLPAIPNFSNKLTVAGGRGIRFTLAVQDIAQIERLYQKTTKTILGNCHTWVYLITSDLETAKLISEKTGKYTVETESESRNVQERGHSSGISMGMTGRALLMADEILRFPEGKSLVLRAREFPAVYEMPDLSSYHFNFLLGFSLDRVKNKEIIKKRWEKEVKRKKEKLYTWMPDLSEVLELKVKTEEETEEIEMEEKIKVVKSETEEVEDFL